MADDDVPALASSPSSLEELHDKRRRLRSVDHSHRNRKRGRGRGLRDLGRGTRRGATSADRGTRAAPLLPSSLSTFFPSLSIHICHQQPTIFLSTTLLLYPVLNRLTQRCRCVKRACVVILFVSTKVVPLFGAVPRDAEESQAPFPSPLCTHFPPLRPLPHRLFRIVRRYLCAP